MDEIGTVLSNSRKTSVILHLAKIILLKFDLLSDNYLDFVLILRSKARLDFSYSHTLPVLPLPLKAVPELVNVNLLEGGQDKGTVRIRRCDLRLIDYQDPHGNILEIDNFKIYHDDSRLVDVGLLGLPVGLSTFVEALNFLANPEKKLSDSKENDKLRLSLLVLCVVLCEATKLDILSSVFANAFKSGYEVPLVSWMLKLINDWGDLSDEMDSPARQHRPCSYCDSYFPGHWRWETWHDSERRIPGATCQDFVKCIGICRWNPFFPEDPEPLLIRGDLLVQIHSVRVYINGGRCGSLYGTIKVDGGGDPVYIYERNHDDCEFIESKGILSLKDPEWFISDFHYLALDLDLRLKEDELQVCKRKMLADDIMEDQYYEARNYFLVRGQNGHAIVVFTVFRDAIIAIVKATLLPKGSYGSGHVCVCGNVDARYSDYLYTGEHHLKYAQTHLFNKPVTMTVSDELSVAPCTIETGGCQQGEKVKIGAPIKLTRTAVVLSLESELIINVELKNCVGKPIVTGSCTWVPQKLDTFEHIIEGHSDDSHLLRVEVTWIKAKQNEPMVTG